VNDELLLETQKSGIEICEDIIARLRSGELTELVAVGFTPGDGYKIFGGKTEDKHTMAGILLELAIERLKDDAD